MNIKAIGFGVLKKQNNMGRLSETIHFFNRDAVPNELEFRHEYHHISKTDELMKARKQYRKQCHTKSGTTIMDKEKPVND